MTKANSLPQGKLRVLLADDNPETRRVVQMMLSSNPDVIVLALAQDGQQAVDMAAQYRPDLVIMDINMPRKDGVVAFKEMSRLQPNLGGILISSELPSALVRDDILPGIQEFLLKPFEFDEFNDAVNRVAASLKVKRTQQAETVQMNPPRIARVEPDATREEHLKKLAQEYARSRRADNEAVAVFEELARNPACELHWMQMLAIIYTVRGDWALLKGLAARLETRPGAQKK